MYNVIFDFCQLVLYEFPRKNCKEARLTVHNSPAENHRKNTTDSKKRNKNKNITDDKSLLENDGKLYK
jgi:hypothetical protein